MAESVESPGRRRLSPPAVGARPGQRGRPGLPARAGARRAGIGPSGSGGRAKAAAFIRRHRLGPYLLLLPSLIGIGLVLLWPTIQVGILSFQNFGLGQLSGALPTQWVGFSNFTNVLTDGEFWLALRITVVFAAVVVSLTLLVGTAVGVLLHHLGRKMATFVSSATLLAWATPVVSASVVFYWLFSPDGGVADWSLSKLPGSGSPRPDVTGPMWPLTAPRARMGRPPPKSSASPAGKQGAAARLAACFLRSAPQAAARNRKLVHFLW